MRLLRHINGGLLAGALVLGFASQATASVRICAYVCDDLEIVTLPPVSDINHPVLTKIEPAVLQLIPYAESGEWRYAFGFLTGRPAIVSIELPDVHGWDLSNVLGADAWVKTVQPAAPGSLLGTTTWTAREDVPELGVRQLFEFRSPYAPTTVTFQLRRSDGDVYARDVFLPLMPEARIAGYGMAELPVLPSVPEPSEGLLFTMGVAVVALSLGRRRCPAP